MEVKKLAVFVEGLTEQLFVERLVRALVEAGKLQIEKAKTSAEVPETQDIAGALRSTQPRIQ